jgi:hypothetical protein
LRGGVWSNLLSPGADLSVTSFQTAYDNFTTTKDDAGKYQIIKVRKIIVHPNNLWKATELLKSGYDPESANNAINVISQLQIQPFSSVYLTDKFVVHYISNGIEKIALNCGKLFRALTTLIVKMSKIRQSAANLLKQAVQRLHGQPQVNWVMI